MGATAVLHEEAKDEKSPFFRHRSDPVGNLTVTQNVERGRVGVRWRASGGFARCAWATARCAGGATLPLSVAVDEVSWQGYSSAQVEEMPEEWQEWLELTPLERFRQSEQIFAQYLAMGGSLDPDPDPTSPL